MKCFKRETGSVDIDGNRLCTLRRLRVFVSDATERYSPSIRGRSDISDA